jgi:glycosyltransferase involved in cell wall biosynthesis
MHENDNLGLITVGARVFKTMDNRKKLRKRLHHYEWMSHWDYPGFTMTFDIGLAPAEDTDFFRAKSQLRFYEYGAVGIPVLGHPVTYDEIDEGVTGFVPSSPSEWYDRLSLLIRDHDRRLSMGSHAHSYVWENCGIGNRIQDWQKAIDEC